MRRDGAAGAAASANTSTTAATGGKAAARPAVVPGPRRALAAAEPLQKGPDEPARRPTLRADDPDAGRGPEGASLK